MRFGSREICDVVLRAKSKMTLGSKTFYKNEPVLYFETLKTTTLEGASTTVYATGGKGNARLISWEGEKTMTFTMEDALLSPESFAILAGAGLIDASKTKPAYVHQTTKVEVLTAGEVIINDIVAASGKKIPNLGTAAQANDLFPKNCEIFMMKLVDGDITEEPNIPTIETGVEYGTMAEGEWTQDANDGHSTHTKIKCERMELGDIIFVDYYVRRESNVQMIEITPESFGGNFYLEASTLFRREKDGVDMPAEFIIPNCKVQSNFTFSMASSGDPSTFSFVMDAFPDYTKFDATKKVFATIQIIADEEGATEEDGRTPCSPGE